MLVLSSGPDFRVALAFVSAVLGFFAFVPYIRDTLAWRTRPQRASWFIWSVLSAVALAAQIAEGANTSVIFTASQFLATTLIFGLSVRRGVGGLGSRIDAAFLALAGTGLAVWYATDVPLYALGITIFVSALGGAITVAKCYLKPATETLNTWLLSAFAAFLAVVAAGTDPGALAYPAYLFILYLGIVVAWLAGRRRAERALRQMPPWAV